MWMGGYRYRQVPPLGGTTILGTLVFVMPGVSPLCVYRFFCFGPVCNCYLLGEAFFCDQLAACFFLSHMAQWFCIWHMRNQPVSNSHLLLIDRTFLVHEYIIPLCLEVCAPIADKLCIIFYPIQKTQYVFSTFFPLFFSAETDVFSNEVCESYNVIFPSTSSQCCLRALQSWRSLANPSATPTASIMIFPTHRAIVFGLSFLRVCPQNRFVLEVDFYSHVANVFFSRCFFPSSRHAYCSHLSG